MSADSNTVAFHIDQILDKYVRVERLEAYFEALMEENGRINLVSRETQPEDLRRLAAESLLPLDVIETEGGDYLDIGSGGGFPSVLIILAGLASGERMMIERTQKKSAALARILRKLNIESERISRSFEEVHLDRTFDLVTLRWVKLTPHILRNIASHLSPGGVFIYYSSTDLNSRGFEATRYTFESPEADITKSFTIFTKKA